VLLPTGFIVKLKAPCWVLYFCVDEIHPPDIAATDIIATLLPTVTDEGLILRLELEIVGAVRSPTVSVEEFFQALEFGCNPRNYFTESG
jgi:hypothetical protein